MAHFAELESKVDPTGFTSDTHQVVKRVVVVGNDCVPSDMHVDGETLGNKLLTIIILENNMQGLEWFMTLQKINFYQHNLMHHGH
jgi:hypothetical protein